MLEATGNNIGVIEKNPELTALMAKQFFDWLINDPVGKYYAAIVADIRRELLDSLLSLAPMETGKFTVLQAQREIMEKPLLDVL